MQPLVDFSFLYEVSDMDPKYIYEVIGIFMDTMPDGLEKLEQVVRKKADWEGIYKQAHFLKSSVSIIKIREMHENLNKMEVLAKQQTDKPQIEQLLASLLQVFAEAQPVILAEQEKNKPAQA